MKRRCLKNGGRPKAFWGALVANLIPAAIGAGVAIYQSSRQARLQREQIEEQRRAQQLANEVNQANQNANSLNNYANAVDNYEENDDDYGLKYKSGGRRKLRNAGLRVTDGGPLISSTGELVYPGQSVPPGTYRDLGPSHTQTNLQGRTGTGLETSNNRKLETQGGETLVVDPTQLMVFSKDLKKNGISYADRAASGENPYYLERQQAVDRRRHLKDGKSTPIRRKKAVWGANFTTPDYVGLGVNTGLSLLSGLWANSMYGDLLKDVNFVLPTYTDEMYVEGPSKWHNEAQRAAILRNDINTRKNIAENTASANVGVGRMQNVGIDAMYELMKLADEKANKETEMAQANATRQQEVRARNAQGRLNWSKAVADTLNQQNALRTQIGQARIASNVDMLQGIGNAVGGFLQSGIDNYQADQARRMQLAASQYGSAERAASMGVDFSPSTMRALRDDAQSRMDRFDVGSTDYNAALDSYNFWNNKLSKPITSTPRKKRSLASPSTTNRPGIWYNPLTGQGQA